ncbi:MAG: DNA mismatch repair endonuclease MutL [Deltaproteobacteria bacterium]|nr:MAG: DNA mismatch repair endonuclease MutL [Deltaproteobacteria bacterium]
MSQIMILPPQVASKIAAGEVISRPASVVKELIENALDAGATTISVEIEDGGRSQIRVVDDGCGMSAEDARLSLERHATSKLRQEPDLLELATLGFRGEALPSLAAVSRLELISRPQNLEVGCRLRVAGGQILENSPCAAAVGTQVTVAELFYNTPARRKFLKSKSAEQGQILELVRSLALGYPEVHFTLKAQGKTVLVAPVHKALTERVAAVLGTELAERLLPFALEAEPFKVWGLLLAPDQGLASTRFQFMLVNRRLVSDRLLAAALRQAYQGRLLRGRYPAAVINLEIPPELVDVNVHPAKAEIRFKDSGRVYGLVLTALTQGLEAQHRPSRQSYNAAWQPGSLTQIQESWGPALSPPKSAESAPGPVSTAIIPIPGSEPRESGSPPSPGPSDWRFADLLVLGQLQASFIVAEAPAGLILIDQHAAHERILYEALAIDWQQAGALQPLLFPRPVELEARQAAWLQDNLAVMQQAGIELEPFGSNSFLITKVPACLLDQDLEALVLETVNTLAPIKDLADSSVVRERLRLTMSCRGAIKAGQRLTITEIQQLLAQLDGLKVSSHCPHGRPLWRLLTMEEIRQGFRRPRH